MKAALLTALALFAVPLPVQADTVGREGALLCKTQGELTSALTIIRNRSLPDHNLRCWNVGPGTQLLRLSSAGQYSLVRQPAGSDSGWTLSRWIAR